MSKFSYRSNEFELLDAPNIPKELLFQNLRELDVVNQTLGGHSITISGIKKMVRDKTKTYHIIDIGCGGGDAMKQIAVWARKNGFIVKITGVDMNRDCVEYSLSACKDFPEITALVMDYKDFLKTTTDIDIIHCSLFCHHLKDQELIELFTFMNAHSKIGFIINDLQRHWFAYYSIKFLTRLFNGSKLVKNDAPLSVLRGFRKEEVAELFKRAKIEDVSIRWKWAFRYLISKNA